MTMPVVILAGGKGTRLGDLTKEAPKSLLEVAGRPFTWWQQDLLRRYGYEKLIYSAGHFGDKIEQALEMCEACYSWPQFLHDGAASLGTGGAARKAAEFLGEPFLIMYGDSYLEIDYAAVERAFLESGKRGLMAVYENYDRWDKSNVWYTEGRIMDYSKTHPWWRARHIDYGLGVLTPDAFKGCPEGPFDLSVVYQELLKRGQLAAYEAENRFYEIGSPEGLEETRKYLESKNV